jgi:hypothetical protein
MEAPVWGIVKKDMLYYLFYFVVGAAFPLYGIWQDGLDRGGVVFMGMCLAMIILFAMFLNEMMEEKSRGYAILRTMPLAPSGIVGAKFILPAVAAGGYLAFGGAVLWLHDASPQFRMTGLLYLLAVAVICLLLDGIFYLALYRLGFTRTYRITVVSVSLLVMLSPILALILLRDALASLSAADWSEVATVPVMLAAGLAGLAGYIALFLAAGRAMTLREE